MWFVICTVAKRELAGLVKADKEHEWREIDNLLMSEDVRRQGKVDAVCIGAVRGIAFVVASIGSFPIKSSIDVPVVK